MKLLILDTQRGGHFADLYVLTQASAELEKMQFGYVPEFHYDKANHQIVCVETELRKDDSDKTRHWLKCFSADNLELILQKEIPERPMYSGYPGRSVRIKSSASGRYLYFFESSIHPQDFEIYRLIVHRYDYEKGEIQTGKLIINSCLIDFDQVGENEDELCFHLACEFPSVVAFGNFNSPKVEFVNLLNLPSRTHGLQETCGSWFSKDKKYLYCINGEGKIFQVNTHSQKFKVFSHLKLEKDNHIPLQQIYLTDKHVLVGISKNISERALSVASQIWLISIENQKIENKIELPFPVINFITTPDDYLIIGVSPYQNAIVLIEKNSGKILGIREGIGKTPAEVLAIP